MVQEITPEALQGEIAAGRAPRMLDVRDGWELEISRLPDALHIPMQEVPDRLGELDPAAPVVVLCRSGARSLRVAQFLEQRGFARVSNLTGGILAWGERIDPSLRPY